MLQCGAIKERDTRTYVSRKNEEINACDCYTTYNASKRCLPSQWDKRVTFKSGKIIIELSKYHQHS